MLKMWTSFTDSRINLLLPHDCPPKLMHFIKYNVFFSIKGKPPQLKKTNNFLLKTYIGTYFIFATGYSKGKLCAISNVLRGSKFVIW